MKSYRYMADISSNNGAVSMQHYSQAGHAAIAIKATEGTGYTNPLHLTQCEQAHSLGLTVVHYHFCRPGLNDLHGEIAHFRNQYLKGWRKGDYVAFDIEVDEGNNVTSYAARILSDFETMTGHPPILYTYQSFLEEHLSIVWTKGRKWIAKYSAGMPKLANWAWQYSDGKAGPEPHFYSGIGKCDGSILTPGVAVRLWVRKKVRK